MGSENKNLNGRVRVIANSVCKLFDSSACASKTLAADFSNPSFFNCLRTRAAFRSRMVLWRVSGSVVLKKLSVPSLQTTPRFTYNHNQPDTAKDSHVDPEQPAPAFFKGDITRDHQRHGRTKGRWETVDGHCRTACVSFPYIGHAASSVCERGWTTKSLDESTDDDSANIGR